MVAFGVFFGMSCSASFAMASQCVIGEYSDSDQRATRLTGLVKEKSFSMLEDMLGKRIANIELGEESDELLRLDFHAAFKADPGMEPLLSEWIRSYPDSYAAHLARAVYFVEAGYAKRGHEVSEKTSEEQIVAMKLDFEKATTDLKETLGLRKQPTLVYSELILLGRAAYTAKAESEVIGYFNGQAPKSLAVKISSAMALNPKWGGSYDQLDDLVVAARNADMAPNEIATVQYQVEFEKADYDEKFTKNSSQAAKHYIQAGELCDSYEAWNGAIKTSYDSEDWQAVIEAGDHLLKRFPADQRTFARRGWAYEKTGRLKQAIQNYEAASRLGDAWAQNKLGWILWQGIDAPKNIKKARRLFELAAAQGNKTAQANLKALNAVNSISEH
jgi:tetratricopeptide (TPR) repeat protein